MKIVGNAITELKEDLIGIKYFLLLELNVIV